MGSAQIWIFWSIGNETYATVDGKVVRIVFIEVVTTVLVGVVLKECIIESIDR